MTAVRAPAVAGSFYPADARQLSEAVDGYLAKAMDSGETRLPKAIIVPHAGYVYSAPIAVPAFAALRKAADRVRRVVLLGPAHRVAVRGLVAPSVAAFRTPLGDVPVDRASIAALSDLPQVTLHDTPHQDEHCLEVQVPFLQRILHDFALVPLVVGDASPDEVTEVLERLWGGPETLIVISSDLSHYHDYATAQRMDASAAAAIESFNLQGLDRDQACGRLPILGLLSAARRHGLSIRRLDLRNSGDTAGPHDRVVGYGSWILTEGGKDDIAADDTDRDQSIRPHADRLLHTAADSLRYALRYGPPPKIDLGKFPAPLSEKRATFVTLRHGEALRGCIGTIEPIRPLMIDVVHNTFGSAFRDPRFEPLRPDELPGLELSISVLSPRRPLTFRNEADLLQQLRPGIDGLHIHNGTRHGFFLPQVWKSLPAPEDFLAHLKHKARIDRPLQPQEDIAEVFTAWSPGAVTLDRDGETTAAHRYN